ncbi:CrcB family protein [Corynebacterium sp. ES2794-CONJ1]|uniref:FluC/FEX family fluoride channel n=1 Tax=unclassified Corynebacterium TaxID=2624378 RepID=UPI002167F6BC|nr:MULTISPECIES: CrcB family protein [unclassified Corynebacterium]MCS4490622.1 CrcB family protein [Corynebacterium sp. ES2775-CONJ]MCS4492423.1 CrcB family protein [Corynebacterium sp. ES2715-CONJ3]MCS4532613.1 CrcB family protein [Corynebacterium sp. ES2730-CONJ]MCU9520007.1 CrcB family protein [Corynebacterium sp. ES2794-CONJ1]
MLTVFFAACCGGALRYVLSRLLPSPAGTYLANSLACLAIALSAASGFAWVISVGFAGALSTWSTLAKELGTMLEGGKSLLFVGYLLITLITGLGLIALS